MNRAKMAATGMNFGPDWLREKVDPSKSGNVTGGGGPAASANSIFGNQTISSGNANNNSTSSAVGTRNVRPTSGGNSTVRYRYSHDELVSYFNPVLCRPPKELQECEEIFVPEPHKPMALLPLTPEETDFYNGTLLPPTTPKYASGSGGATGAVSSTSTGNAVDSRKYGSQNGTNGSEDYDLVQAQADSGRYAKPNYDGGNSKLHRSNTGGDEGRGMRNAGQNERKISGNSGYSLGNGPASPGAGGQFILPGSRRAIPSERAAASAASGNASAVGGGTRPPGFRSAVSLFNRMSSYDESRSNSIGSMTGGGKKSSAGLTRPTTDGNSTNSASLASISNTFVPTWRQNTSSTTSSAASSTTTVNETSKTEWRSDAIKTWRTDGAAGATKTTASSKTSVSNTSKESSLYSLGDVPPGTLEYIQRKQRQAQAQQAKAAVVASGKVVGPGGGVARGGRGGFEDDFFKPTRDGFDTFLDSSNAEQQRDFFSSGNRSGAGDSFRSKQPPGFARYQSNNGRDRDDRGYEFAERWNRSRGYNNNNNNNSQANELRDPREPPRYQPSRGYFNRDRGEFYRTNDRRQTAGGGVPDEDERTDANDDDFGRRDSLPEWSLDDTSTIDVTKVGTFDASGAFHEAFEDDAGDKLAGKKRNTSESDKSGLRERKQSEKEAANTAEIEKKLEFMSLGGENKNTKTDFSNLFGAEGGKTKTTNTVTSKGMFFGFEDELDSSSGNDFMAKYLNEAEKESSSAAGSNSDQKPASLEANKNFLNERFQQFKSQYISKQQTKQQQEKQQQQTEQKEAKAASFQHHESSVMSSQSNVNIFGGRNGQLFDEESAIKDEQHQQQHKHEQSSWDAKMGQEFYHHKDTIEASSVSSKLPAEASSPDFGLLNSFDDFGLRLVESSKSQKNTRNTDEGAEMVSSVFAATQSGMSLRQQFGIDGLTFDDQLMFGTALEPKKQIVSPGPIGAPKPAVVAHASTTLPASTMLYVESLNWFYCDPQNNIQGPFQPTEMNEWFVTGYFPVDLLVRRGCDQAFSKLVDLYKACGERSPFVSPPIQLSEIEMAISTSPELNLATLIFPPPILQQSSAGRDRPLSINEPQQQQQPIFEPNKLEGMFHARQPPAMSPGARSSASSQQAGAHSSPTHQPWQGLAAGAAAALLGGASDICNLPGIGAQPSEQVQQQIRTIMAMFAAKDARYLELNVEQQYSLALERFIQIKQHQQQQQQQQQEQEQAGEPGVVFSQSQLQQAHFGPLETLPQESIAKPRELMPEPKAIPLEEIEKQQQTTPVDKSSLDPLLQTIPGVAWAGALSLSDVEELQRREAEENFRKVEDKIRGVEEHQEEQQAKMQSSNDEAPFTLTTSSKKAAKGTKQKQQRAKTETIEAKASSVAKETPPPAQQLQEPKTPSPQPQQQQASLTELQLPKKSVWGSSVAPIEAPASTSGQPLTLAEIQKIQEEKEEEKRKVQQQMASFIASQHQQKVANKWGLGGWQTEPAQVEKVKTLAEIQAEEARTAKLRRENEERRRIEAGVAATIAGATPLSVIVAKGGGVAPTASVAHGSAWGSSSVSNQPTVDGPPAMDSVDYSGVKSWIGKNGRVDPLLLKKYLKSNPKNVLKLEETQLMRMNVESIDELYRACIEILSKSYEQIDASNFMSIIKDLPKQEVIEYTQAFLGNGPAALAFTKFFIAKKLTLFGKNKSSGANSAERGRHEDETDETAAYRLNVSQAKGVNRKDSTGGQQNKAQTKKAGKHASSHTASSLTAEEIANLWTAPVETMDEFDRWCGDVIKANFDNFNFDVETFITFLKEIDSPDEVTEYVNQYLNISKASRDFAKHFITKRSYLRNKARQQQQQEDMCGPAPAITPSTIDNNGFVTVGGGNKKKRNKKNKDKD